MGIKLRAFVLSNTLGSFWFLTGSCLVAKLDWNLCFSCLGLTQSWDYRHAPPWKYFHKPRRRLGTGNCLCSHPGSAWSPHHTWQAA